MDSKISSSFMQQNKFCYQLKTHLLKAVNLFLKADIRALFSKTPESISILKHLTAIWRNAQKAKFETEF